MAAKFKSHVSRSNGANAARGDN
ncbi:hypothetical protein CCACVL1_23605 [Corchorus capsularis]|uniref:Uncharacterized protein n=1 Tax=Corchorus capsularis TaxID=210143 RepID=A0A1R3GT86_COCAP|nr:hypothetical protein CCACVL1_23605 [Corchorus capsularis]